MTAGGARHRVLLGSLLASRVTCACLCGAALGHLALVATGLPGWPCPVRSALGIPCPGCGLGRAGVQLLRGEFSASLHTHAFAGMVIGALVLFALAVVLPGNLRRQMAATAASLERRGPLLPALLGALLIYWLWRFAVDAGGFIRLAT